VEDINAVPGIGMVIAEAVTSFFHNPDNRKLVDDLGGLGLTSTAPETAGREGPLVGTPYVITGCLPPLARDDATRRIELAGGRVAGSVSKKSAALLAGDDPGGKLEKAKALGVEVIDEAELLRRVR
jgi:DNA ligase (NAD+)